MSILLVVPIDKNPPPPLEYVNSVDWVGGGSYFRNNQEYPSVCGVALE
jgi:hypothetical protein